jgi:hypothetical protein
MVGARGVDRGADLRGPTAVEIVTAHRTGRIAVAVAVVAMLGGCVTPANDAETYAEKAILTSADAVSELRTAALAGETWLDDRLLTTYFEVVVVGAESALGAVTSTFTSIQPPDDAASDRLNEELGTQLGDAGDALEDLRIAVRRRDRDGIIASVHTVTELADQLEQLTEQLQ